MRIVKLISVLVVLVLLAVTVTAQNKPVKRKATANILVKKGSKVVDRSKKPLEFTVERDLDGTSCNGVETGRTHKERSTFTASCPTGPNSTEQCTCTSEDSYICGQSGTWKYTGSSVTCTIKFKKGDDTKTPKERESALPRGS